MSSWANSMDAAAAANRRWALTADRKAAMKPAHDGRLQRYKDQVLEALPQLAGQDAEVTRRAEQLRKADMIKLSRKAAMARTARAGGAR